MINIAKYSYFNAKVIGGRLPRKERKKKREQKRKMKIPAIPWVRLFRFASAVVERRRFFVFVVHFSCSGFVSPIQISVAPAPMLKKRPIALASELNIG